MAGDSVFDALPDLFFKRLKQQMLLGLLPSKTVETILKPLLDHYDTVMRQLPADLQIDIENILRVYREIAQKYDVKPSASVTSILDALWEEWKQAFADIFSREPVHGYSRLTTSNGGAGQGALLQRLKEIAAGLPRDGRGHFMTDKGNHVILELWYEEEHGRFCFRSSLSGKTHIYLCRCHLLTLQPEDERNCISSKELLGVLLDIEDSFMDVEIRED